MKSQMYMLIFLPLSCFCEAVFVRVGNGYYYIESENLTEHYFDWFFARLDCWSHTSSLVSLETMQELLDLEKYVSMQGFPEGSTFATSGHSFRTAPDFWWDGVDEAVTLDRWLPGTVKPSDKSYLSLELINSTLYMRESFGQADYYICEYSLSVARVWMSLNPNTRISVLLVLLLLWLYIVCRIIFHTRKTRAKLTENISLQKKHLLSESSLNQSRISVMI